MQADIWAKRSEAGDIYELDPLLVEEATCTRTVFSTLVDELAHQGHLLVRHNKGLRCKVCNVYRAYRQFRFWSRHPCVPRPNAAAVISQFKNKKRQLINTSAGNSCHVLDQSGECNKTSSKHDEKELYHGTSLGYRDIQPELDLAHTHQCCDYSLSQTAEQSKMTTINFPGICRLPEALICMIGSSPTRPFLLSQPCRSSPRPGKVANGSCS